MQNINLNMDLAIDVAWRYQGLTYPNPAVGAVVTHRGKIVSIEAHQKAGTSHAEVLALVEAYISISGKSIDFDKFDALKSHNFLKAIPDGFFSECDIFVTLEPCNHFGKTPSCASLLEQLELNHIYIATKDIIKGHSDGAKRLKSVTIGIREREAKELLEPFLIWQKRAFVLFKIAQTTNGKVKTDKNRGYLSSKESLLDVHKMREVCSRLMIGGQTIRDDLPTLDCRFSGGDAPDIFIYSKKRNFDPKTPLFSVKDRDVQIGDNLSFLKSPSFIIVEGSEGMQKALKDIIDWYLIYQTPTISNNNAIYNLDMDLKFLKIEQIGRDMKIWSRVVK